MKRFGDAAAGFSAEFDTEIGTVRVRGWGFWSASVSAAFPTAVYEVCKASPKGSSLAMEMNELKPLREEGQRSFGALIRMLPGLGVGKVSVCTASHLTRLQLLRLVAEHGMKDAVEFTSSQAASPRDGSSDKTVQTTRR
jgi:hypothetical protein